MANRARKRASEQAAEPDPPAPDLRAADELAALADVTVGPAELADVLLMTRANVSRLAQRGVVTRVGTGRYSLIASCTDYIKFLKASGRYGSEPGSAKGRFQEARAQIAEIELRDRVDGLLEREAVDRAWAAIVESVRSRILALPAKVGPLAHGARTIAEASEAVRQEVYAALTEIARTPVVGIDPPAVDH